MTTEHEGWQPQSTMPKGRFIEFRMTCPFSGRVMAQGQTKSEGQTSMSGGIVQWREVGE